MRNTAFTLLLLCTLCGAAAAQSPNGYIVRLPADTVPAFLRYKKSGLKPDAILATVNGVTEQLTPADIAGFGIFPDLHYRSRSVRYHTNPIEYNRAPAVFSEEVNSGNFFLQLVEDGGVALYELILPERHYYFYEEKGTNPVELLYRVRTTMAETVEDGTYKTQLNGLLAKYGLQLPSAREQQQLTYDDYALASHFRRINRQPATSSYSRVRKRQISGGLLLGMNRVWLPDTFRGGVFDPPFFFLFPSRLQWVAGVQFQYFVPGTRNRLALELQAVATRVIADQQQADTARIDAATYSLRSERYYMKNQLIFLNLAPALVLNPGGKVQYLLKPGGSLALSVNNSSLGAAGVRTTLRYDNGAVIQQVGDYFQVASRYIWAQLQLGAALQYQRFRWETTWYPPAQLMQKTAPIQLSAGHLTTTLGYRLF
ncbi:MAG TPA: hypothetical protein PKE63_09870 [Lacibacter sp.]|nr:hypothetical protein [Lacibacter sp.]HMO88444.1 hypothetical protein [Lacibacter sp.]HMP87573.1 hypothetical protein [Lacibacter sp.]